MNFTIGSLHHHWNIVAFRAQAMMATEASKTYLNFLWWIVDPLFTMVVFYIVFAMILKRGTEDYPIFLLVGLVAWQWFGNTVSSAAHSIQQARSLINQVKFPKIVLPLTVILTNTYKFLFVIGVLLVVLWTAGYQPTICYAALPFLMFLQLILIYGTSTLVASLIPLLPDLQYVVTNFLRAMMFLSGIFYPLSTIPEQFQSVFLLNPMVSIIDAYRNILMYGQWPFVEELSYAILLTVLISITATVLVNSLDVRFGRLIDQR